MYPPRVPVSDESCRWFEAWADYAPPTWTHDAVLKNARDMGPPSQGWADPPELAALRSEPQSRTTFASGNGVPQPMGTALLWDEKVGAPLNPVGRTGLAGRGLLGKWGANHAADPIVTRFHPQTGQLQVVAIQRKDTGQWAIPGGMVDPGENVSVTVKREFTEEAGAIADEAERQEFLDMTEELFSNGKQVLRNALPERTFFDLTVLPRRSSLRLACVLVRSVSVELTTRLCRRVGRCVSGCQAHTCSRAHAHTPTPRARARCTSHTTFSILFASSPHPLSFPLSRIQVYRGYVDDPRSTDNAWMETTAFHFHCSDKIAAKLPLKAGDDAGQVMWLDVSMANETYSNLYGAHRALIDEAVFAAWSRGEFKCRISHAVNGKSG